jgi:3(or 17)beta-hydroxysteroid dehydrogenase
MTNTKSIQDKVCIVTGAASGIGEATARLLAQQGATVVIADMQEQRGRALADEIAATGSAAFFKLDVTDEKGWADIMADTLKKYTRLDVLVNNAGIGYMKPILDMTLDEWQMVMRTNLDSVFLGVQYAAKTMARNQPQGGAIVNVSSSLVKKPKPDVAAYCASKKGVNMLTKIAAIELAEKKIRVNTVLPGPTLTPIWEPLKTELEMTQDQFNAATTNMTLLGGMAAAIDIAEAILYFASDAARFVTGTQLLVDGGEVLSAGDIQIVDKLSDAAKTVFD